jgi:hypothetical protein
MTLLQARAFLQMDTSNEGAVPRPYPDPSPPYGKAPEALLAWEAGSKLAASLIPRDFHPKPASDPDQGPRHDLFEKTSHPS